MGIKKLRGKMFLVILLYIFLALTFVFAKFIVQTASPIFIIASRMLLAGGALLLYEAYFRRKEIVPKKNDWWLFLKTSLFHIYFSFVLEFWAIQYISSAKANLIYSATPFITAALSYFLLQENISLKKFMGMSLGLIGLTPILFASTPGEEIAGELFKVSLPELVLLISVTSAAYAWFLVKELMKKGYSLTLINGIAMFIGGIEALITCIVFEVINPLFYDKQVDLIYSLKPFLFWLIMLIIVANFIVYNLYGWLLRKYSLTFLTFAGFLCPIFGAFFGWLLLNEKITWHYFVSLACISFALYIFYMEEKKNKHAHKNL